MASVQIEGLFANAKEINGLFFVSAALNDSKPETLRALCDNVRGNRPNLVMVLSTITDGKGSVAVCCGANAVAAGAHSGKIIKAITSVTGGNGGGRPESAMGGVADIFKIDEAVAQMPDVIRAMLH